MTDFERSRRTQPALDQLAARRVAYRLLGQPIPTLLDPLNELRFWGVDSLIDLPEPNHR